MIQVRNRRRNLRRGDWWRRRTRRRGRSRRVEQYRGGRDGKLTASWVSEEWLSLYVHSYNVLYAHHLTNLKVKGASR